MVRIRVTWPSGEAAAALKDTATSRALLEALPCSSHANTWGEEVYFHVPVDSDLEPDAQQVVPPGTVCFWVEGSSLAIPYGPTPISQGDECRPVTKVNILGRLEGSALDLATVGDGDAISVDLLSEG